MMNMIVRAGGKAKVSSDPRELATATRLIIPGVGSFDHGVMQLKKLGYFGAIQETALRGIPLLGICLGMQLLCNRSEEGIQSGLSLIDAECKKFSFGNDFPNLRSPHVGWNNVKVVKESQLSSLSEFNSRYYFTHSYHVECAKENDILGKFEYGGQYVAAISHDNVFGVQFHPEKSHRFGMALFKNFLSI